LARFWSASNAAVSPVVRGDDSANAVWHCGESSALAVFSTAFAFVIYFRLIQTLGSVGTTAQAYLRVPIGVALGVLLLGESLSPTAWIGLGCVVVGVAAMTIPARKPLAIDASLRS